ncbi:MAG: metalloregulator ArsR/SmtB family transcription factor [Anaerolineae bacterium]|nr:metalloregulator ArsR/SmtB family transcription factor [Anaerolineae bacterium]
MLKTRSETSENEVDASCCVAVVTPNMSAATAQQIADDLQILAHPIRLQILDMLRQCDCQICVCDIEGALPVKQPTVSHHLKLLREAGLIDCEKRGLYAYYFIKADAMIALWNRVQGAFAGVG